MVTPSVTRYCPTDLLPVPALTEGQARFGKAERGWRVGQVVAVVGHRQTLNPQPSHILTAGFAWKICGEEPFQHLLMTSVPLG